MKKTLPAVFCLALLLCACSAPRLNIFDTTPGPLQEYTLEGQGNQKILIIPVTGMISDAQQQDLFTTHPSLVEKVVVQLNKAKNDSDIKAVLLKVNSSGGTITASDILYHEIEAYRAQTKNKVAVIMMDVAASGAYYLSLPADLILAHPTTLTGSVGVIFMRPKVFGLMNKIGLDVEVSKYGVNKDMGSPFRESNNEEIKLMQKTVDQFGDRFISLVKKHRKLDAASLATVSTARIFVADEALQLKLIDKIGYLSDAVAETRKLAGLPQDAKVIVYRRQSLPEESYYSLPGASVSNVSLAPVNAVLAEILPMKAGFYYLWPGAINFE